MNISRCNLDNGLPTQIRMLRLPVVRIHFDVGRNRIVHNIDIIRYSETPSIIARRKTSFHLFTRSHIDIIASKDIL